MNASEYKWPQNTGFKSSTDLYLFIILWYLAIFHSPLHHYAGEDLREGPGVVGSSNCHFLGVGDGESDVTKRQGEQREGTQYCFIVFAKISIQPISRW